MKFLWASYSLEKRLKKIPQSLFQQTKKTLCVLDSKHGAITFHCLGQKALAICPAHKMFLVVIACLFMFLF
jgi:hypothetical protein